MIIIFLAKYLILVFPFFLVYLLYQRRYKTVILAVIVMVLGEVGKFIVGRIWHIPRPFVLNPSLPYYREAIGDLFVSKLLSQQYLQYYDSSFFSGHAAASFAAATVVFLTESKRSGVVLFIVATLIALGRVFANVHYPIDVLGGGVIGVVVGLTVSNLCVKLLR